MSYCSNCGVQLIDGVKFCNKCGVTVLDFGVEEVVRPEDSIKLVDAPVEINESKEVNENDLMAAFIGNNQAFYLEKWKKLTPGKVNSWNWPGFFLGFIWLAYRKVNYAWILAIGSVIVAFVSDSIFGENYFITVAVSVVCGLQGNFWYKLYTEKNIKELSMTYSGEELKKQLSDRGGTSIGNAVALTVAVVVFSMVMGVLLY